MGLHVFLVPQTCPTTKDVYDPFSGPHNNKTLLLHGPNQLQSNDFVKWAQVWFAPSAVTSPINQPKRPGILMKPRACVDHSHFSIILIRIHKSLFPTYIPERVNNNIWGNKNQKVQLTFLANLPLSVALIYSFPFQVLSLNMIVFTACLRSKRFYHFLEYFLVFTR